jgi:hypothetical protein
MYDRTVLFHQYLAAVTQSPGNRQCRTLHFPSVPIASRAAYLYVFHVVCVRENCRLVRCTQNSMTC